MKTNDKIILVVFICILMILVAYAGYETGLGKMDILSLSIFTSSSMLLGYSAVEMATKTFKESDKEPEHTWHDDIVESTTATYNTIRHLEDKLLMAINANNEKLLKKLDETSKTRKTGKKEKRNVDF